MPMISIVIPTLNEEEYLPRLLDSLAEQSFRDFEAIVVDGGSADRTVAVASARQDEIALRLVVMDRADLSTQRNVGAKQARGDWLLFVDADSVLMPYTLERCMRFVSERDVAFFTTWCRADTDTRRDALLALVANVLYEFKLKSKRPYSPGPFTAIRKEAFDRVGGYAEGRAYQEDYDLSVRAARAGIELRILRETLYEWSTRRVRKRGFLPMIREWTFVGLYMLVVRRPLDRVPGYVMGGQEYRTEQAEGTPSGGSTTGFPARH